ncbi:VENN motif pre-toxin domain-containing protein, partial [Klebsiella aerogenes]
QISAQVSRTATADYDTGGKYQKVAQAVTAAMQGLAGGNLAQAASGAVNPYVAEIIHSQTTDSATGKVNVEANAMAHAVWGAIAAASGNNSALAGAAGAVSGELLGRWIAAEYYPDVKTEELSDEQKSTISALSTLAAGLMGGLSGGSSADAVAGAQAGKNAVENNLMGGNEWSQGEKAREHGADVLSCADNPSGEACQRGIAENKAYAGALASAGLIYLPGGMQITGAIGGTANAGIQYLINGEVNPTDVLIATYVGAFTRNTGLKGTMSWNAAGGATSSYLKGDNPFTGGLINGLASGMGYGAGKLVELPFDKVLNPMKPWKDWIWTDVGMGISKPLPINPVPGIAGNAAGSAVTEILNDQAGKTGVKLQKGNQK